MSEARLFIALDLPRRVVEGIESWQREALDDRVWRPVRQDAMHLTLKFLGSRPEALIPEIVAVARAAGEARGPEMSLKGAAVGIPRRRPRAVAFEADAPKVATLAEGLSDALEVAGLTEREDRPYWPHVTVARRRGRGPLPSLPLPDTLLERIMLNRLVLYRSETLPDGARHHPEAAFGLRPPAGGGGG